MWSLMVGVRFWAVLVCEDYRDHVGLNARNTLAERSQCCHADARLIAHGVLYESVCFSLHTHERVHFHTILLSRMPQCSNLRSRAALTSSSPFRSRDLDHCPVRHAQL